MLPSDFDNVARILTDEARAGLTRFTDSAGAAEAARLVENFGRRLADLGKRFAGGAMSARDLGRAIESERDALAFNLAAITNENKRAFLAGLIETGLSFLAKLLNPL